MLIRVAGRNGAVVIVERKLLAARMACPDRQILVSLPVVIAERDIALRVEVEVRCVGDPLLPLLARDRALRGVEGVLGAMNVNVVAHATTVERGAARRVRTRTRGRGRDGLRFSGLGPPPARIPA